MRINPTAAGELTAMIRQDLATVRLLACGTADGQPPRDIQDGIQSLATNGSLWSLRMNCLLYCRFVGAHHHGESAMLFPALRRSDPALGPVVDKLEADHLEVAGQLDGIEAAAQALVRLDTAEARQHLVDALGVLATDLLAHLEFEEEQISPTLRTWT